MIARIEQVGATIAYKRIYFDGRASEIISKPGQSVKAAMAARSQRYYVFDYGSSVELVDTSHMRRVTLPTTNMRDSTGNFTIGFAAEQPYYQAADGLHFVDRRQRQVGRSRVRGRQRDRDLPVDPRSGAAEQSRVSARRWP